jgi:hypothetical protein
MVTVRCTPCKGVAAAEHVTHDALGGLDGGDRPGRHYPPVLRPKFDQGPDGHVGRVRGFLINAVRVTSPPRAATFVGRLRKDSDTPYPWLIPAVHRRRAEARVGGEWADEVAVGWRSHDDRRSPVPISPVLGQPPGSSAVFSSWKSASTFDVSVAHLPRSLRCHWARRLTAVHCGRRSASWTGNAPQQKKSSLSIVMTALPSASTPADGEERTMPSRSLPSHRSSPRTRTAPVVFVDPVAITTVLFEMAK